MGFRPPDKSAALLQMPPSLWSQITTTLIYANQQNAPALASTWSRTSCIPCGEFSRQNEPFDRNQEGNLKYIITSFFILFVCHIAHAQTTPAVGFTMSPSTFQQGQT